MAEQTGYYSRHDLAFAESVEADAPASGMNLMPPSLRAADEPLACATPRVKRALRVALPLLLVAFATVALLGGFAIWRFGSIRNAAAYAAGRSFIVEPTQLSFGRISAGSSESVTLHVTITSLDRSLTVLGSVTQ